MKKELDEEQALILFSTGGLKRKLNEWLMSDKLNICTIEVKSEKEAQDRMNSPNFKFNLVIIDGSKFNALEVIKTKTKKSYTFIVLVDKSLEKEEREKIEALGVESIIEIQSVNVRIIEDLITKIRIKNLNKIKVTEKYQFIKKLGFGTSGEVILMRDTEKDVLVAVKKINLELMDETQRAKASKEVDYLQTVKGPTIIEFYGTKLENNVRYIYLEYAEKNTLEFVIKQQKNLNGEDFDFDEIFSWFCQILIGVFSVHNKKMIHRDIKSENILITGDNIAKLSDLGISRMLGTDEKANTLCGTPYYLPPEIIREVNYDYKIDIWSMGVMLYELATKKLPFQHENVHQLYEKIKLEDYPELPENTDFRLKYLISIMLRKDPKLRFSAEEIISLDFVYDKIMSIIEKHSWKDKVPIELLQIKRQPFYQNLDIFENKESDIKDILTALKFQDCFYTAYKKGFMAKVITNYSRTGENLILAFNELSLSESLKENEESFFTRLIQKGILIPLSHPNDGIQDSSSHFYVFSFEYFEGHDNITILKNLKKDFSLLTLSKYCLFSAKEILEKLFTSQSEETSEILKEIQNTNEYIKFLVSISLLKYFNLMDYEISDRSTIIMNIYQTMLIHFILYLVFSNCTSSNSKINSLYKKQSITYAFKDFNLSNIEIKHVCVRNNKPPQGKWVKLKWDTDPMLRILDNHDPRLLIVAVDFPENISEIIFEKERFNYHFDIFDSSDFSCQVDDFLRNYLKKITEVTENMFRIPKSFEFYINEIGEKNFVGLISGFVFETEEERDKLEKEKTQFKISFY